MVPVCPVARAGRGLVALDAPVDQEGRTNVRGEPRRRRGELPGGLQSVSSGSQPAWPGAPRQLG
jgi:hypothetical protein